MPLREFICPEHGKFERLCAHAEFAECPVLEREYTIAPNHKKVYQQFCGRKSPLVEWSVPAKRNPRYGEG